MRTIYVLVAWYSDGSGEPEILRAFTSNERARCDLEMLKRAGTYKTVDVFEVKLDESR